MILEKDCKCTTDLATEQIASHGPESLRQDGRFRPTPVQVTGEGSEEILLQTHYKILHQAANQAVTGKDHARERACEKGDAQRRRSLDQSRSIAPMEEPLGIYETNWDAPCRRRQVYHEQAINRH